MARRSSSRGRRGASKKTESKRQTRAVSRKKPAGGAAEAEVVEEADGMGMEGGIAVITALMLLAGCLFLDYHLGSHYDAGLFF